MFGYDRDETIGRKTLDLNSYMSPRDRAKLINGTCDGASVHDLELCFRAKRGELREVQVSAEREEIAGRQCLITVIRDISDRKRAEEAQQNMEHLSRLAVMGELTAMVAHEVNQPLSAILSNAEAAEFLLESKDPPLGEIRQIVSDIRKNERRADQAIRKIGSLLRRREMRRQQLNLNETISEVLELVTGDALRRHVDIRTQFDQKLQMAFGDKVYLQQVLLNLVVNAMDAMVDKSKPSRHLTVQTKTGGGGVLEVAVSDCGHGIPPDRIDRIFESFFTTKKDGIGLGLSIARSIIEAHQGRIWAESNSEGGATFHFTIPTAEMHERS